MCVLPGPYSHAATAREDPASCVNCFIMPARTREARCLVFKGKRPAISTPAAQHSKRAKHPKGAELRELGSGFRSGPAPIPTPPSARMGSAGMAARPYPLATDIEEKEEEEDEANFDVDVESLFPDTDEEGLSSGQPQAGPEAEGAESSTQLSHLTRALVERLLEPSVLTPWQRLTPPPPSLMRLGGRLPRGLSRNGRLFAATKSRESICCGQLPP